MSKYITHFQTEAEYQTALPSLDLPNVSLVDELGEVHYHRALYGAHAGDICLYDVAEGQKIVVTADNWNLTDYPTASYPIIGVVVADETADGVTLVSTLELKDDATFFSGASIKWINSPVFDFSLTKYTTAADAKTDFNGKENTALAITAIRAYDSSHSTDNITGNIGYAIENCSTPGTNQGDWYIPAGGELNFIVNNFDTINTTLQKIKTANSNLASLFESSSVYTGSTERDQTYVWMMYYSGSNKLTDDWKTQNHKTRPFCKLA